MSQSLYHKEIYILTGPTAIGKTELSLSIAEELDAEIICADSMQIYKYFDIGSAKPTLEECNRVPHHMVDFVAPDEHFDVAFFVEQAEKKILEIWSRGKNALLVGGTMMYLSRLVYGIFPEGQRDDNVRRELQQQIDMNGSGKLHSQLESIDPESFKKLHPNDAKRIIRAWEVYILTGKTMKQLQDDYRDKRPPLKVCGVGLDMDRQQLYRRVNKRTKEMFKQGLIEEVIHILTMGYCADLLPFQSLAYKETVSYLRQNLSLELAMHKSQKETRNFAKRQLTWLRSFDFLQILNVNELSQEEKFDQAMQLFRQQL